MSGVDPLDFSEVVGWFRAADRIAAYERCLAVLMAAESVADVALTALGQAEVDCAEAFAALSLHELDQVEAATRTGLDGLRRTL